MKVPTISSISAALFGVSKKHCDIHTDIAESLKEVATRQAVNVEQIKNNTKRLDIGSEDFKDIRKAIAGLDKSFAVLAEKAKQRRNVHKGEDDETNC